MKNLTLNRMPWKETAPQEPEPLLTREWLVTNGLGGYASGTISGASTRRYHGLLIAALPTPHGRVVMLSHLSERIELPNGDVIQLSGEERAGSPLQLHGAGYLKEFRLEAGLPVWLFEVDGTVIEKRLLIPYRQNTVHIGFRLLEGEGLVRLKLQPSVHFRPHDSPVSRELERPYILTAIEERYEFCVGKDLPPLRMELEGDRAAFTLEGRRIPEILYRVEESRGYESMGDLWSPGYFRVNLAKDRDATLIASTESWEMIHALDPAAAFEAERERRTRLLAAAHPVARSGPAGVITN